MNNKVGTAPVKDTLRRGAIRVLNTKTQETGYIEYVPERGLLFWEWRVYIDYITKFNDMINNNDVYDFSLKIQDAKRLTKDSLRPSTVHEVSEESLASDFIVQMPLVRHWRIQTGYYSLAQPDDMSNACIVGEIFGSERWDDGKVLTTSLIKYIDPDTRIVRTENSLYELGSPGDSWAEFMQANGYTLEMYQAALL